MMNGMTSGMGMGLGAWGLVMLLTMLALLGLAVVAGVWLYHQSLEGHTTVSGPALTRGESTSNDAAQGKLRKRYATGKIDDEEYARRLSALTYWR